ncbi:MAG: four-helix bundle copper-binding protein [Asticcacaulis sp.]
MSEPSRDAINTVWECRTECMETLYGHCLQMGGPHTEAAHIRLMSDCIQACQTCADFMTRGSALHAAMCRACAEVCQACAESCAAIDSQQMQHCAETCRRCADTCREMGQTRMAA